MMSWSIDDENIKVAFLVVIRKKDMKRMMQDLEDAIQNNGARLVHSEYSTRRIRLVIE